MPVQHVLDSAASVERLLTRLRAEAEAAAEKDDTDEDDADDDESGYREDPGLDFDRFYESLPPFPREAHDDWMPAWLHEHLERRVPRLAADRWALDPKTEDETLRAMAAALRDAGFVVTDENLVPRVASWVDRHYALGLD